ncbi:MAG: TonB-dependent receptor [Deltaproteobacteria bacterium]|jgi:vitamin B12 transporter|nr:TonB-dependent receptor [Deltaproteobacteria bacterium]
MIGTGFRTFCGLALAAAVAAPSLHAQTGQPGSSSLDPVVVTAVPAGELRHRSTATVMVIDQEQIRAANASSMTDLLATTASAFLSEWTPAQTSINIRGGVGDGQGKDFKGQIMVLMNGRRAGTTNLSKLSPSEVERVEIMRGPNSVMYGSQAMGGIVNIILKSGRTSSGGLLDARGGSAELVQGHAEYARELGPSEDVAFYLGGDWAHKSDYRAGKKGGKEINTAWTRKGGMADLDWKVNESNTIHANVRSDGIYDTGFRGSAANYNAKESRSNHSADLEWIFDSPDFPVEFILHNYLVHDIDDFRWMSPATARTVKDYNKRRLNVFGSKFQPVWHVASFNDLRFGVDFEYSTLRTDRFVLRDDGVVLMNPPQDMNQTETLVAFYAEDTLKLFDDRFTLRAGLRHTIGWLSLDKTPNVEIHGETRKYEHNTWSVGMNLAVTDSLSLRAGAATGFRSPVASELGGWTRYLNQNIPTYGNPSIKPETNVMYEAGLFAHSIGWFADLAVFHNVIKNRIYTRTLPGGASSMFDNREADSIISGLEFSGRVNVDELADLGSFKLAFGFWGSYNFKMEDEVRTLSNVNTNKIDRMYEYQGSIFAQIGSSGTVPWLAKVTGVLRGPVYYDTEENLIRPKFEPVSNWIHRKSPFWVFNLYGEASVTDSVTVYGGVNNVFNKNYHPLFIALDDGNTYLNSSNGGQGTSSPGAEFYLGVKYSF